MPSGQDLVNSAARFRGQPYSTAGGRCSQTSGYKDCSGLVSAALSGLGIFNACGTSTSIELWATRNGGNYVTRQYAMDTPGVGCAIWGYGSGGHIGISAGGGNTIETPSAEGHRVGFSPMTHDRWGEWFTFPGIGGAAAPPPPPKPNPGVKGMMIQSNDGSGIWLIGPGNMSAVPGMQAFDGLRYMGVPFAGSKPPLEIIKYAQWFGANEIRDGNGNKIGDI